MTAPLFGVVGWKNSGKTTLMVKLISVFAARGLRVAAVKHAHHGFDVDHEGRDSFRYREAGATTVALSSAARVAIMTELQGRPEPSLGELFRHIEGADIILVEGFKREGQPKLEVRRRAALNQAPLAPGNPSILAVAADFDVAGCDLPAFALDDVEAIANFISAKLALSGVCSLGQRPNPSPLASAAASSPLQSASARGCGHSEIASSPSRACVGGAPRDLKPRVTAADDCFAFPTRRLRHEEALAQLQALTAPLAGQETVSVFAASGRVCAERVTAPRAIPAHTNAAVDGYAFSFADYDPKEGATLPIAGRAAAGDGAQQALAGRSAARIFTGAIMPRDSDTVAMQEDCRLDEGGAVFIPGGLKEGANRRLAGEDMAGGAAVAEPGQRLRPQDAAALAASGRSAVACFRPPRICIFSTGDEVLAPGAAFAEGKVYDANGPMLCGLFKPLAPALSYGGVLPDTRAAVEGALHAAAREHDLIVVSGGASLGEEDHVIAALRAGQALSLWQLAIKPGRPMGVGGIGSCLCFALPGNPVAVMVCALLYVWPAARRLSGEPWIEPQRLSVPAGFEIKSRKQGRREYFRGWLAREGDAAVAMKYERDGSGLISSLRAASGLIEIPEDAPRVSKGEMVTFIPFSAFTIL